MSKHEVIDGGDVAATYSLSEGRWNDAVILGVEPESLQEFLNTPASMMVGEMRGQRDRRNTQDEQWNSTELTWGQWIGGQGRTNNTAPWGFSRHPVGKDKAGPCVVLGSSIGKARKAKAMSEMFAMGLDIDSGAKLDDVLKIVEELGLLCLVYTSYNHGKRGLQLKRDEVLRKLQIKRDPSNAEIRQFLREFDKNRYEETFIAECKITELKKQVKDGVVIELSTPPLEKFRLIFPLEEAVKIIDLAETHEAALSVWEDKITGLARNLLGVHFDRSCTDPSRLFFTARHPKDAEDWYSAVVMGEPLRFDDVKPMKKSTYTANREDNAFTQAGGGDEAADRPPMALTPSGASLNDWHRAHKDRFMLAELMETLCSDKIRVGGGESQGMVHTECPFEHEHTSEGGTATMAINCLDSQNEYWTWFCHHDACQGRHKLVMLEEALRQQWFDEENLFNVDLGFILEGADEEADAFELEANKKDRARTSEVEAKEFDKTSSQAEIEGFIRKQLKQGVDMVARGNITEILARNTNLGKLDIKALWKAADAVQRNISEKKIDTPDGIYVTEPAPTQTQYAKDAVKAANDSGPFLFEYMGQPVIARHGRLKSLDRAGRRHELGKVTAFQKPQGDSVFHIYPPYDVVDDLFSSDLSEFLLPLAGVKNTPFFSEDGKLVTANGYNAGSEMYLDSDLVMDRVSDEPTEEEAQQAAFFIVEEVLADFPLGGLSRAEIMEQFQTPSGVPAVANALAMMLLPFARNMIHGPTPGHVINKPAPGTGAGFLVDVCTTIGEGVPAPAMAMPKNKDEMPKTLGAAILEGRSTIFFDNINQEMESPEMAAAMTSPFTGYMMRILGKSQTALVRIMATWVFTANTLTMSSELLRRCILVDLDRKAADPAIWIPDSGWRHVDVREWTRENRARLVHACLTIIQRWVSLGMIKSEDTLGSFENWAGIMGGILKSAGVAGFMGNQSELTGLSDGRDDDLSSMVQAIAEVMHGDEGARLYVGSKSSMDEKEGKFGLFDILHGMDDTPRLDNWGYKEVMSDGNLEVQYHNNRSAGIRFKAAAKRTYGVTLDGKKWTASFEMKKDAAANLNCYKLTLS